MTVVAFQEDRVLFGPKVALATHRRLQAAVAARGNPVEAEALFLEAQREDPECLPAFFALYKFYFNTVQFEKAAATARRALVEAARQGGFSDDWTRLDLSILHESVIRAGEEPAHFFRFTLKALSFISLRQGNSALAKALLAKLDELDPEDTVGGSVIRSLARRMEEDDD